MFDQIKALAPVLDEEERFPEESLVLLTEAGLTAPPDTAAAVKAISDTARVCGSTAACLAAIFAAEAGVRAAGVPKAEAVHEAAAAGQPVSICTGELSVGKDGVLSGHLRRVPFAGFAQYYIVINAAADTPSAAFLISGEAAGLKAGAKDEKLGLRGFLTGDLFMENAPAVPLGAEAAAQAEHSRWLFMAAVASGLLLGGIDEAVYHAYRRVQFGKRITEFENTRFVLAQALSEARAAEALLEKAASIRDEGGDWAAAAAMAKLCCADAACRGLRKCVQVMSGRGYVRDFPEEVKLRDAKTAEVFFGATDVLKSFITDVFGIN